MAGKKKIRKIGLGLLPLLFSSFLSRDAAAEVYEQPSNQIRWSSSDAVVLGANAAIGCAIGAIPSAVRKENVLEVLENCVQGALGGSLIYAGQKAASVSYNRPGVGWLAHSLVAAGASVRENVAAGQGALDRIAYDLGPLRLSVGKKEANGGKKLQWYLLPGSLTGIAYNLAKENHLDVKSSLYHGNFIFVAEVGDKLGRGGAAFGNTTTISQSVELKSSRGLVRYPASEHNKKVYHNHEQVHAVSYREFGTLDLALRESATYQKIMDEYHLSLGSDLLFFGTTLAFSFLPHDSHPMELVPTALVSLE